MRIVVDEMPATPSECPYGNSEDYGKWSVTVCDRDNNWCFDTNMCPHFISLAVAIVKTD